MQYQSLEDNLKYLLTAKSKDPAWKTLEGKYCYSKFFSAWLRIYSVENMSNWYFMLGAKVTRAQTPLIYFVKEGFVANEPKFKEGKNAK